MRAINGRELSSKFVVSLLQGPEPAVFAKAVQKVKMYDGRSLAAYQYGLFMPCADRSLDAIYRSERPDMQHVRIMMSELAYAVQHVHDNGVVHGDLKMLNVLRVNNSIRLIDLDAAALYDAQDPEATQYAGAKFSSGVLPPCMFVKLNDDEAKAYSRYWASERDSKSELWQKIKPERGRVKKNATYVVKTFRTIEETGAPELEGLPYAKSLVKASPSFDIWSFGLILYKLCAGGDLCPVNRDDDLTGAQMYERCATWRRGEINKEVEDHVHNDDTILAADLIRKLLHPDPKQRYKSMEQVLQHPFLIISYASAQAELVAKVSEIRGDVMGEVQEVGARNTELLSAQVTGMETNLSSQLAAGFGDQAARLQAIKDDTAATRELALKIDERTQRIDERTVNIEKLSIKTIARIEKTEQVLLRGMIEASDVQVPSCFIIVNQKLDLPDEYVKAQKEQEEQEQLELNAWQAEKAAKATLLMSFFSSVGEGVLSLIENTASGVASISSLVSDPFEAMFPPGEEFWLYLIDESTMKPVVPLPTSNSPYPLRITTPADFAVKYMPYMKLGLTAMSAFNGAAGFAQCLGYPVPKIPSDVTEYASKAVGKLDHKSSVDSFDVLQGTLDTLSIDDRLVKELAAKHGLEFPYACKVDSCLWKHNKHSKFAKECEKCGAKNATYDETAAKAITKELKAEKETTEKKTVRGKGLYDFEKLLMQPDMDPNHTFCDMRRVLTSSGKTIWTMAENVEKMEQEAEDEAAKEEETGLVLFVEGAATTAKGCGAGERRGGGGASEGGALVSEEKRALQKQVEELTRQLARAEASSSSSSAPPSSSSSSSPSSLSGEKFYVSSDMREPLAATARTTTGGTGGGGGGMSLRKVVPEAALDNNDNNNKDKNNNSSGSSIEEQLLARLTRLEAIDTKLDKLDTKVEGLSNNSGPCSVQ